MSTTTVTTTKAQKTRKDRDKERDKERKSSLPQPNERLKTVIRRLPPNLPEDVFWQSVQPWVTEYTTVFKIYYPGKLRKKLNKENIPSRAYVAFKTEEQLALFSREYDGHIFRDKTGVESQAVVEFAPYPKIPTEKKKPDTRNATIEKDEDYISFLESLKASENAEPVSLESLIASSQPPPPPKTTPLLEALKAERSANKDKEAILRNHAHYNQVNNGPSRKEEKKKAAAAAPPSLPSKPSETTTSNAAANVKKAQKKAQAQANATTAPAQQNAKNSQHGASAFKNAANGTATANQTPKAAKPARPPRAPAAKPDAPASVPPTPTDSTPADAPAPAPRRSRPVIGLGSRQFEAALSGVAGLAGAASERKRREKEKEKEKLAAAGDGAAVTAPSVVYARIDNSDPEKPIPPPASPKKEKTRRGTRGGGGGGGATAASAAPAATLANGTKVPNILQRSSDGAPPVIIQRNTSAAISTATPAPAPPSSQNVTRGGGRRGRGGGRGRGGAASGAASGSPRAGG